MKVHFETIKESVLRILSNIDTKPEREGLANTPKRYAKFLNQFLNPPKVEFTCFKNESENAGSTEGMNEMIIVKDIPFYSLCEHHMVPFFGVAHVGYIPDKKIVGLSKIPRVVDMFSRRLQNQERITDQISSFLMSNLLPHGVAVVLSARHLCVEMRGVEKPGTITVTSSMKGKFKMEINTRQEFLSLIK